MLHRTSNKQLRYKVEKLHKLLTSVPKKVQPILASNLSAGNLDTELSKYGLQHSYIDRNEDVERNFMIQLESISIIPDKANYLYLSSKQIFHEYIRASTNITEHIYSDHDNTFKSLTNQGATALLQFYQLTRSPALSSRKLIISKANTMSDEGTTHRKQTKTSGTAHFGLKRFQDL